MKNMEKDFDFVCSKINEEKEFLNSVSQGIWRIPELQYEEFHAHEFLSNTLSECGFDVQKHYLLNTAFKTEYSSKRGSGPTVAILLEYDALPVIGHGCGHNLIAEAGVATAVAIKALMDADPSLAGKLVVLGTPAEEGGGGKIQLVKKGAFEGIDVALMVHPSFMSAALPPFLCNVQGSVEFKGKEAHAAAFPWEGRNALDAAVACYNSLSLLRQHIKPMQRIHIIITEGGVATNIIPAKAAMKISVRAPTMGELKHLKSRVEDCITASAISTGCEVSYKFEESGFYENVITNKILGNLYGGYFEKLGHKLDEAEFQKIVGSTDMGNVSHVVPAIHPFFAIPSEGVNHTKEFTEASGSPAAQDTTLAAAKAMAMTAITVMRDPNIMNEIKKQFKDDLLQDSKVN